MLSHLGRWYPRSPRCSDGSSNPDSGARHPGRGNICHGPKHRPRNQQSCCRFCRADQRVGHARRPRPRDCPRGAPHRAASASMAASTKRSTERFRRATALSSRFHSRERPRPNPRRCGCSSMTRTSTWRRGASTVSRSELPPTSSVATATPSFRTTTSASCWTRSSISGTATTFRPMPSVRCATQPSNDERQQFELEHRLGRADGAVRARLHRRDGDPVQVAPLPGRRSADLGHQRQAGGLVEERELDVERRCRRPTPAVGRRWRWPGRSRGSKRRRRR